MADSGRERTMPVDDVLLDLEMHFEKSIDHLLHELRGVRTGRANPAIVENIKVDYYGSPTDIRSIANISVPEATQILIKPFSPGDLRAIEKAVNDSKLGLTCLLYTSDAADERSSVDLGGRRIIKKKK